MVAVLIGTTGNLQVKTGKGEAGSFTQEAAMWGLGTMMAIYIAGGISGAHCKYWFPFLFAIMRTHH
jgi:aquaglyceroporin related protein